MNNRADTTPTRNSTSPRRFALPAATEFQAVSENAGRGGDSVFSLICRSLIASKAVNGCRLRRR